MMDITIVQTSIKLIKEYIFTYNFQQKRIELPRYTEDN